MMKLLMGTTNVPWAKVTRPDNNEDVDRSDPADAPVTTFAGSVTGLAGVFSCTATGAVLLARPRRAPPTVRWSLLVQPGTWTFAPTDPNGTIDVPDDDGYVQFGWWLNMKGKDVDDGFDVQTFASAPTV